MNRTIAGALALVALALTSCATFTPAMTGANPVATVARTTPMDERAVFTLSNAGLAAERAFSTALRTGLLQPRTPETLRIANLLVQVDAGIDTAEAAYSAGNAAGLSEAVTRTQALIAQAQRLTPTR